jgi:hypothetical protein
MSEGTKTQMKLVQAALAKKMKSTNTRKEANWSGGCRRRVNDILGHHFVSSLRSSGRCSLSFSGLL